MANAWDRLSGVPLGRNKVKGTKAIACHRAKNLTVNLLRALSPPSHFTAGRLPRIVFAHAALRLYVQRCPKWVILRGALPNPR